MQGVQFPFRSPLVRHGGASSEACPLRPYSSLHAIPGGVLTFPRREVYTDPSTGGNTTYVVGSDKMLREARSRVCNFYYGFEEMLDGKFAQDVKLMQFDWYFQIE